MGQDVGKATRLNKLESFVFFPKMVIWRLTHILRWILWWFGVWGNKHYQCNPKLKKKTNFFYFNLNKNELKMQQSPRYIKYTCCVVNDKNWLQWKPINHVLKTWFTVTVRDQWNMYKLSITRKRNRRILWNGDKSVSW